MMRKSTIEKWMVAAVFGLSFVALAILATTNCVSTGARPLSGCERLAIACHNRLAREGKESYIAYIQYKKNNPYKRNHAAVQIVQRDGKFRMYDPALRRYRNGDEYKLIMPSTKDHGFYGGSVTSSGDIK